MLYENLYILKVVSVVTSEYYIAAISEDDAHERVNSSDLEFKIEEEIRRIETIEVLVGREGESGNI